MSSKHMYGSKALTGKNSKVVKCDLNSFQTSPKTTFCKQKSLKERSYRLRGQSLECQISAFTTSSEMKKTIWAQVTPQKRASSHSARIKRNPSLLPRKSLFLWWKIQTDGLAITRKRKTLLARRLPSRKFSTRYRISVRSKRTNWGGSTSRGEWSLEWHSLNRMNQRDAIKILPRPFDRLEMIKIWKKMPTTTATT